MLFLSKRDHRQQPSSNKEACLSILGLFVAVGLLSGLAGLIYGLVASKSSATIAGGIVFGVCALLSVILILIIVCCVNKDEAGSQDQRHQHAQNHTHARKHPTNHHHQQQQVTTISDMSRYAQTNESDQGLYPTPIHIGLSESMNYGASKHASPSPTKTASFTQLNQSTSSANTNYSRQHSSYQN